MERRSARARIVVVIAAVGLATGLVFLLRPAIGEPLFFPPFTLAVVACALFGGFWAGLAATALSAASNVALAWPFDAVPTHSELLRLGFFVVGGLVIALIGEARLRALAGERRHRAWLQVTMASLGDALVVTDRRGAILFMNRVAEDLMQTSLAAGQGRPLGDVFRIVNEETRQPAANPVDKVLATGSIVGLANHTVLIRPDGTEIAIDDSAAPVMSDGEIDGVVLLFRDISSRRAGERVEREAAGRLALHGALVEQAYDAIFVRDMTGTIIYWNHACERLYGWSAAEAIGKNPHELLATEFPQPLLDVETTITERGLWEGELVHAARNGSRLAIESRQVIVNVPGQRPVILEINRDITARQEGERVRARLLEEAQQANRLKDEFLTTISHELRTPLNAVLGWARMLVAGTLKPESHARALQAIARNAEAQARLVEDLLDISRIVRGTMQIDVQLVNVAAVIEAALESVRPAAEAKQVEIATNADEDIVLIADPARLQQILWNMLSNAVKFTPSGGRVDVEATQSNGRLELVVRDTGIGIPAEFLPHVFDRFRQFDSSERRSAGGVGLGLAIVRHLAELHGGFVRVESDGVGTGATFTVTLPIRFARAALASSPAPGGDAGLPQSLAGLRVLVVDDDEDARDLMRATLEAVGADVVLAASGEEGLAAVGEERPDIIISDIGMPVMDGFDFIERVRAMFPGRLPAIALTAYSRPTDRQRALAASYDLHIAKPVTPDALVNAIARLAEA